MPTFSRVYSAQPHYLKGSIVTVEIDISKGLHSFSIVGLPDKAVEEARDRVGSAIKNSGFTSPKSKNQKLVVSLAPAQLRKTGSYFDVAIAIGYLLSSEEIIFDPSGKVFIGELSLNGDVMPVRGVLAIAHAARDAGYTEIYVPTNNAAEAALVGGLTVYPITNLLALIQHIDEQQLVINAETGKEENPYQMTACEPTVIDQSAARTPIIDFADIRGQETAKRGLEIAAAGGHNVAMYGPPGTGKTMLAKAFAHLLPSLDRDDVLEVTSIHSIAGTLRETMITNPPFRSPHHTASYVSVIGGGSDPRPGEVTLAHKGVLFMDEFPLFDSRVLESLRQPLEDRVVTITRAKGSATFPTAFMLVAAMNPPPDNATAAQIERHRRKISGPIMDRIDIWFPVEHLEYSKLSDDSLRGEDSTADVRERVMRARAIQHQRFKKWNRTIKLNAHMTVKDIDNIQLLDSVTDVLNTSAKKLKLSPRSYHRVIKLARTIADLAKAPDITESHILEALQYRPKDV